MKVISVRCPSCGAVLEIEENRRQAFCSYCGAKIALENENEYVYRHVDEAKLKDAETEQMIRLRQIEMEEKQNEEKRKTYRLKVRITLVVGVIGFVLTALGLLAGEEYENISLVGLMAICVCIWMWLFSYLKEEEEPHDGRIRLPASLENYQSMNYADVKEIFADAGFTNVRCRPLHDLSFDLFKKSGRVESITIDGEETTSGRFFPDAVIIISYHCKRDV